MVLVRLDMGASFEMFNSFEFTGLHLKEYIREQYGIAVEQQTLLLPHPDQINEVNPNMDFMELIWDQELLIGLELPPLGSIYVQLSRLPVDDPNSSLSTAESSVGSA